MFDVSYDGFSFFTDDPVFAASIANGTTEPYPRDLAIVKRYCSEHPEKCKTYVDVGAHIGTTIAPYSRIFQTVVGFEANPATFAILKQNMRRNGIQCRLELFGAYSHACRGDVLQHGGGNSGCYYFRPSETGVLECKALDDYGLTDVDFLKIDTEGSELYVLQGARQTILRSSPLIQLEYNGLSDSLYGTTKQQLLSYLDTLGYCVYDDTSTNLFFQKRLE